MERIKNSGRCRGKAVSSSSCAVKQTLVCAGSPPHLRRHRETRQVRPAALNQALRGHGVVPAQQEEDRWLTPRHDQQRPVRTA